MNGRVTDETLERYALGELDDVRKRSVAEALSRDPELRARLEGIRRSDLEILKAYPPARMARIIRARAVDAPGARKGRVKGLVAPAAFLATAAAVAIFFAFPLLVDRSHENDDPIRFKGDSARLFVYRKGRTGPELLKNGATARGGDLIQLAYRAGKGRYAAVLSIDGAGAVTMHLPAEGAAPAPSGLSGKSHLPNSYELDDAPGFERFILVVCGSAPEPAKLRRAAERLGRDPKKAMDSPLPAGTDCTQESLLLMKVK